jgi:hypothetical protein
MTAKRTPKQPKPWVAFSQAVNELWQLRPDDDDLESFTDVCESDQLETVIDFLTHVLEMQTGERVR